MVAVVPALTCSDLSQQRGAAEDKEQVESFCHYPEDTTIIDNLVYSKVSYIPLLRFCETELVGVILSIPSRQYCSDLTFKNEILIRVKRELQQGRCVLLRSQWLVDSLEAEERRVKESGCMHIGGQDATRAAPEDVLREAKQVLRSVCMACLSFSGHDFLPPVEEARRNGLIAYLEMLVYSKHHPDKPP